MGGFLTGTGWLLAKGGVGVAASVQPYFRSIDDLLLPDALSRWIPALVFGALTVSGLLERIRKRVDGAGLRYLVIDLRRVTGLDSSAVMSFRKVAQLAEANGFDLVLTDAPEVVRRHLERGGVVVPDGVVRFEPDLDRGLQWCEDGLLEDVAAVDGASEVLAGLQPRLWTYFERQSLAEGTDLISQGESPDDVFVLESGRPRIELMTHEGTQDRLSTVLPGVMVGEIALARRPRGLRTWWPRYRAWSCGSAAPRSRGWKPRSLNSRQRSTVGSRRRWPSS